MAERLTQELLEFIRPILEPVDFVARDNRVGGTECHCGCGCMAGGGSGCCSGKLLGGFLEAQIIQKDHKGRATRTLKIQFEQTSTLQKQHAATVHRGE